MQNTSDQQSLVIIMLMDISPAKVVSFFQLTRLSNCVFYECI